MVLQDVKGNKSKRWNHNSYRFIQHRRVSTQPSLLKHGSAVSITRVYKHSSGWRVAKSGQCIQELHPKTWKVYNENWHFELSTIKWKRSFVETSNPGLWGITLHSLQLSRWARFYILLAAPPSSLRISMVRNQNVPYLCMPFSACNNITRLKLQIIYWNYPVASNITYQKCVNLPPVSFCLCKKAQESSFTWYVT